MVKITVVTAVLSSDFDSLLDTFSSVKEFLNENLTWIIKVNCPHHPESFNLFVKHPFISVIFKTDTGIYVGLNQALDFLEDGYFFVLGAGDRLRAQEFRSLLYKLSLYRRPPSAVFAGIYHVGRKHNWLPNFNKLRVSMSCPHPATLLDVRKVRAIGGFDTRYNIAADFDLVSRYIKLYKHALSLDLIIIDFEGGGLSEQSLEGPLECELIKWRVWGDPIRWRPIKEVS